MGSNGVEEGLGEIRDLALDLLRQGERCVVAGLTEQAEAILAQAWAMANKYDLAVADAAAWHLGWLSVQRSAYAEAGKWFSKVTALPTIAAPLWSFTRQVLEHLCHLAATQQSQTLTGVTRSQSHHMQACNPSLPHLKIVNLGEFQVIRDGIRLPNCKARKPIAILRYLLTRRRWAALKEELMDLFWPNASPPNAAHSLHVAISALRHYLDPGSESYVLFEAGHYQINPEAVLEDDCSVFKRLIDDAASCQRQGDPQLAQQLYIKALAYYQDDYYQDDYDLDWAIAERERLLARYLSALEYVGNSLMGQQHFEPAIVYYKQLLERDVYREDIHCQLMRCYWELGRRSEALRQYTYCAHVLERDLGLELAQDTTILFRKISNDA